MPILVGLMAVIGGIVYWIWRAHYAVGTIKAVKEIDRDTQGLQRHARNAGLTVFGTKLQRVQDPRLAATILMLQLVRTGSPVTAAEKTRIMELMEDVRAWSYTEQHRIFSPVADELVPVLRQKLTPDERLELVEMLKKVATAYGEASELRSRESIVSSAAS